jgi:DNA-binding transcriptional regulator of glucitol operon
VILTLDLAKGQNDITPEEMAIPPAGEVQALYLRDVGSIHMWLTSALASAPPGIEGQGSPWFEKFQTFNSGLATVASSKLQSDCFSLIPQLAELLTLYKQGAIAAQTAKDMSRQLGGSISMLLINAMERRVIDENASVPVAEVEKFVTAFSTFRLIGEGEGVELAIDRAGVMILNPSAVLTKLETLPVKYAAFFLNKGTATEVFARYETGGDGIPALKTAYAANKTEIIAKWNELAVWVAQNTP